MDAWYNKYAVIVLAAMFGYSAYNWIDWSKLSASDWGTWLGAIGTIGATGSAIWLATRDERRRRSEALDLARLTAAALIPRLMRTLDDVDRNIKYLESLAERGSIPLDFSGCAKQLQTGEMWKPADLVPLLVLENHCAATLAGAAERISINIYLFSGALQSEAVAKDPPDFVFCMHRAMAELHYMISHGLKECQKAVRSTASLN